MVFSDKENEFLSQRSILIVEDDQYALDQIVIFLSHHVKTIFTANDGAEGLAAFRKYGPDIVITDIIMPVIDGITMASEIRNSDSNVPIVALTALEHDSYQLRAIDAGVDIFVKKPVNCTDLIQTLLTCAQIPLINIKAQRNNDHCEDDHPGLAGRILMHFG